MLRKVNQQHFYTHMSAFLAEILWGHEFILSVRVSRSVVRERMCVRGGVYCMSSSNMARKNQQPFRHVRHGQVIIGVVGAKINVVRKQLVFVLRIKQLVLSNLPMDRNLVRCHSPIVISMLENDVYIANWLPYIYHLLLLN